MLLNEVWIKYFDAYISILKIKFMYSNIYVTPCEESDKVYFSKSWNDEFDFLYSIKLFLT